MHLVPQGTHQCHRDELHQQPSIGRESPMGPEVLHVQLVLQVVEALLHGILVMIDTKVRPGSFTSFVKVS